MPLSVITHNIGDTSWSRLPANELLDLYGRAGWSDIYLIQEIYSQDHLDEISSAMSNGSDSHYYSSLSGDLHMAVLSTHKLGDAETMTLLPNTQMPMAESISRPW